MSPSGESTNGSPCSSCISGDIYGDDFRKSDEFTCKQCKNSDSKSKSKSVNDSEKLRRIIVASVKGFTIGTGLKGGLAIFSIVARFARRRRSSLQSRKTGEFSNSEAIAMGIKETLRYGLFLGTFAGTFVSVDEAIAALAGDKRTAKWRALFAGLVAGPSMLLTGPNTQHTSLAVYILMRAAVLASRCGIKSKRFGTICKPLTWKHGDLFLMCLSSSQILSAYILKQESLPSSYKSFLNKHGGKDLSILQGVKDIASAQPFTNLRAIEKYYKSVGVDIKLDPNMKVPCSIIHGNESCVKHGITFFLQAYKRALPVYVPVYLIPALIVHRQDLLKKQYSILGKGLLGTARSSLFLATYCSSAWAWTCLLFRTFETCNIPLVAIATFPTGLALAIEKKSRRIEISLYCLARAIESFFTCMTDAGYIRPPKSLRRADVVVFSVSTAIIMHCYAQEREVFRSKYLNVLDWVFGVPPPPPPPPCETT
ncbi:Transmembrane protein 135 N-terminal domain [Arabidopsis thaliana x Arabidopsis arenosa]|uniref:Transmembrane protein 135 N-terminal domain n=1 Tax=Arabidopsis thaliana x Arabidopsis arenosa TaxID=1240361 RepID=A0A8T2C3M4_9BRAS|nr:Transmembrane protein 135 N-terminal domain [Arabidopsis thaliana x Arabidopsis arenosa]